MMAQPITGAGARGLEPACVPRHAEPDRGELNPVLAGVFERWKRAGIRWVLLREPRHWSRPASDIDLLVAPGDAARAGRMLEDCGFARRPPVWGDRHYVCYDAEADCWLWLHVIDRLAFGPGRLLHTGAEEGCLGRSVSDGWIVRLAAGDAFWAGLLHCLLDRRSIPARYRSLLQYTPGAEVPLEFAAALRRVRPDGPEPEAYARAAAAGDWTWLEAEGERLRRAWYRADVDPFARLRHAAARRLAALASWHRRRGLTIAIVGPDGAGKTTLVESLRHWAPWPSTQMYMGLTGGALRHAARLRVPGIGLAARLAIIWSRYLRAQWLAARGRMVVIDRYVVDGWVDTPFPLTGCQQVSRWLTASACPKPDLLIVLDAPGSVMHARKGEYDPRTLDRWRVQFLRVGLRPWDAVLDASRDPAHVRREAGRRIWARYRSRWGETRGQRPEGRGQRSGAARHE